MNGVAYDSPTDAAPAELLGGTSVILPVKPSAKSIEKPKKAKPETNGLSTLKLEFPKFVGEGSTLPATLKAFIKNHHIRDKIYQEAWSHAMAHGVVKPTILTSVLSHKFEERVVIDPPDEKAGKPAKERVVKESLAQKFKKTESGTAMWNQFNKTDNKARGMMERFIKHYMKSESGKQFRLKWEQFKNYDSIRQEIYYVCSNLIKAFINMIFVSCVRFKVGQIQTAFNNGEKGPKSIQITTNTLRDFCIAYMSSDEDHCMLGFFILKFMALLRGPTYAEPERTPFQKKEETPVEATPESDEQNEFHLLVNLVGTNISNEISQIKSNNADKDNIIERITTSTAFKSVISHVMLLFFRELMDSIHAEIQMLEELPESSGVTITLEDVRARITSMVFLFSKSEATAEDNVQVISKIIDASVSDYHKIVNYRREQNAKNAITDEKKLEALRKTYGDSFTDVTQFMHVREEAKRIKKLEAEAKAKGITVAELEKKRAEYKKTLEDNRAKRRAEEEQAKKDRDLKANEAMRKNEEEWKKLAEEFKAYVVTEIPSPPV